MKETSSFQHPYNVTISDNSTYQFITEGGILYVAYFICCSHYAPELTNTFMFNFENEGAARTIDLRVRETIVYIIDEFFKNNQNSIIYICDSLDGRELARKRLFDQWYITYKQDRNYILREEISEKGEHYNLCASLLFHSSNPDKAGLLRSFNELKHMLI